MGRIQFRVLGRPEVAIDGEQLDLGAPKQQAVLAALMSRANKVVSGYRLAEAVWPMPPAAARANLRGYLAALRRLLQVPGEARSRLESSRGGHRLRVFGAELDLHVFEELAGRGEHALGQGRLAEAADLFEQALGLWRGPILDGVVHGAGLHIEVVQLEEKRLTVTERWAQALQELGEYERLTTVLRGLVAQHPLRERLWAYLINALHRSARSGEALAAYARVRAILADELGAEPGPELRHLHLEALRGGGSQSRRRPAVQNGVLPATDPQIDRMAVTPRQLPAFPTAFCGRTAELRRLKLALSPAEGTRRATVLAINGTAGVGKSALAMVAAHEAADAFPDGQLYVDMQGATPGVEPLTPVEVLGRFLRALGVRSIAVPGAEAEAAALFRSIVAKRRILVVLDDAACAAQVRPLLPGGAGCATLVTSRSVLTGLIDAGHLHLDTLPPAESISLLERSAGVQRVTAEPAAAARLAELCGHLPLALRIIGARLAARPGWLLSVLVDRLAAARRRLDELSVADIAVRTSIGVTYHGLPETSRRALRHLGMLGARDFAPWVLAALLEVPLAKAEQLLEGLLAVHLLELASGDPGRVREPGDPRYRFHDLVRLFAQERGADEDSPPERSAALSRVIDASLDLAQRADRRMSTDFLGAAGHRAVGWNLPVEVAQQLTVDPGGWFDRERGFLVATVSDGLQAGMAGRAGGLAAALTSLFEVRNHFADWRRVQTSSLSGALRAGDRHTAMRLHRGLGELDTIQDHYTEAIAHFEAALGLGDVVDPAHESALTAGLGYLHRMKGRYEPAIHYFTRARGLAEEAGNRQGLVYAVNNIGVVHLERGELVPAIVCFSQCLQLSQELEYLPGQAQSLRGLGHVRRAEQDDDAAAELYQRAARISRSLGDRLGEAHALCWLGKVFIRQGRHGHARRLLSRCLWVYREFGNAWGEAATLWILADAQLAVGRLRPARLRAGQAVAIWRGIASPYWLTQGLHTLAAAYEHEGDTVAAQGLRQQAAALRAEQGLSRIEA